MLDISRKSTETLDLRENKEPRDSRQTIDLSRNGLAAHKGRNASKNTNFYEYMPVVTASSGTTLPSERVVAWMTHIWDRTRDGLVGAATTVREAMQPLRVFWLLMVGLGFIVGLLVVSYVATHRSWEIYTSPIKLPGIKTHGARTDSGVLMPGRGGASGVVVDPSPASAKISVPSGDTLAPTDGATGGSSVPAAGFGAASGQTPSAPAGNPSSVSAPIVAPIIAVPTASVPTAPAPSDPTLPVSTPAVPASVNRVAQPVPQTTTYTTQQTTSQITQKLP